MALLQIEISGNIYLSPGFTTLQCKELEKGQFGTTGPQHLLFKTISFDTFPSATFSIWLWLVSTMRYFS